MAARGSIFILEMVQNGTAAQQSVQITLVEEVRHRRAHHLLPVAASAFILKEEWAACPGAEKGI